MIANRPMYRQTVAVRQGKTTKRGLALSVFIAALAGCSASGSEPRPQQIDTVENVDLRQTLGAQRNADGVLHQYE